MTMPASGYTWKTCGALGLPGVCTDVVGRVEFGRGPMCVNLVEEGNEYEEFVGLVLVA